MADLSPGSAEEKGVKKFTIRGADAASAAATFHAPPKPLPLPPGVTISQLPSKLRPVSKRGNTFKKSFGPASAELGNQQQAATTQVEKSKVALGIIKSSATQVATVREEVDGIQEERPRHTLNTASDPHEPSAPTEAREEDDQKRTLVLQEGYCTLTDRDDSRENFRLPSNLEACPSQEACPSNSVETMDRQGTMLAVKAVEAEIQRPAILDPVSKSDAQGDSEGQSSVRGNELPKEGKRPSKASSGEISIETQERNRSLPDDSSEKDLSGSPKHKTSAHWMTSEDSFTWDGDDVLFCRSDDDTDKLAIQESEKRRVLWVCRPGGDLGVEEGSGKSPEEIDSMLRGALRELLPDWDNLKIECDELFHATKGEQKGKLGSEELYDLTQKLIDRFGCQDEAVLDRIGLIYTTVAAAFETSEGMSAVEFRGYVASVLTQILHELESRNQEQADLSPNEQSQAPRTELPESEEFSENALVMLTKALHRVGLATTDIARAFVGLAPQEQQEQQEPSTDILESTLPTEGGAQAA